MYNKVNAKEQTRTNYESKMYFSYGFVKVARDCANLISLLSPFHNFAPRYERAFKKSHAKRKDRDTYGTIFG